MEAGRNRNRVKRATYEKVKYDEYKEMDSVVEFTLLTLLIIIGMLIIIDQASAIWLKDISRYNLIILITIDILNALRNKDLEITVLDVNTSVQHLL